MITGTEVTTGTALNNSLNISVNAWNSVTQQSLTIHNGMSDIQIVAKLCTDYHFAIIGMCTSILIIFVLKAVMARMAKRRPNNETIQKITSISGDMADMLLIMMVIIQLCVAVRGYFG